jgi:hypothetical protein
MAIKSIPIKDICLDGGTQQRPLDDDVVKRYAALMKEIAQTKGEEFPPVEITTDGKNYFLTDGFHRVAAARKNGKKYIEAFVVEGNRREAIFLSFSANIKNAFPRQPGTVKGIVEKILKDEEWAKMSQREIARYVGCTQAFVWRICEEIKKSASDNQLSDRTAKTGQKTGLLRSKTVNVKQGKSEYEAKKPEKKVLDSTAKQVPEHLVKYFKRANEYRQMIKQLNDMLKTVRKGKEASDLFYRYIKIENLTADINNVKRIFRFALPYSVCPYCGGDENNKECRACDGCGFVNEMTYKATPGDLK